MGVEKKELLKMLREAEVREDRSLPIYSKHLRTALFWSGLDAATRERLRTQLGMLENGSEHHAKALTEMVKKIKEDKRDVF